MLFNKAGHVTAISSSGSRDITYYMYTICLLAAYLHWTLRIPVINNMLFNNGQSKFSIE